jgi:hypothetical protein
MITTSATPTNKTRSAKRILINILKGIGIFLAIILGVVLFLGLFPVSYKGLKSQPNPAASYEEAIARYQEIELAENGLVHQSGHSYRDQLAYAVARIRSNDV